MAHLEPILSTQTASDKNEQERPRTYCSFMTYLILKLSLLFALLPHTLLASPPVPPPPTPSIDAPSGNAGCLIRSGDQVVLVKDIWSKRYGLPGGTAEKGETAAQTAVRETFEETGIIVSSPTFLAKASNSFYIYDCQPRNKRIETLAEGRIAQPKDTFNEIGQVVLINPKDIPSQFWRFPEQRETILNLIPTAQNYEKGIQTLAEVHPIILSELKWIAAFQSYQNGFLDRLFELFSFFGGEEFTLLLLPLIWFGINKRKGFEITLFLSLSILLHGVLKQTFEIPRPFYFMPTLQRAGAEGFGFPSGHTLTISLVWMWVGLNFQFRGRWLLAFTLALLGGIARVYWGAHFIHDVIGGWVLGLLLITLYATFLKAQKLSQVPLKTWILAAGAMGVPSLLFRFHPESVALLAFLFGLISVLAISERSLIEFTSTQPKQRLLEFGIVFAGILGLSLIFKNLPVSGAFLPCLYMRTLKYLLIGLWMGSFSLYSAHLFPQKR